MTNQYISRALLSQDGGHVWSMCEKTTTFSHFLALVSKVKCFSNTSIPIKALIFRRNNILVMKNTAIKHVLSLPVATVY